MKKEPGMTNAFRIAGEMVDITAPSVVQVVVSQDGSRVWVNVDGECRLRCCHVDSVRVLDARKEVVSD